MRAKFAVAILISLIGSASAFAGADVPPWLQQAAATTAPAYDKDVPAVVLLNDQRITVTDDGRVVRTRMYAVRILNREGRSEALAREIYQTDTGKVRELQAWLIRSSSPAKHYGKDQTIDIALATNDVYNEYRAKAIVAGNEADTGNVFGYQVVSLTSIVSVPPLRRDSRCRWRKTRSAAAAARCPSCRSTPVSTPGSGSRR